MICVAAAIRGQLGQHRVDMLDSVVSRRVVESIFDLVQELLILSRIVK